MRLIDLLMLLPVLLLAVGCGRSVRVVNAPPVMPAEVPHVSGERYIVFVKTAWKRSQEEAEQIDMTSMVVSEGVPAVKRTFRGTRDETITILLNESEGRYSIDFELYLVDGAGAGSGRNPGDKHSVETTLIMPPHHWRSFGTISTGETFFTICAFPLDQLGDCPPEGL
jgi:hypothetical protein